MNKFLLALGLFSAGMAMSAYAAPNQPGQGNRARQVAENGWHSIGTGTWYEGLMTIFNEIPNGLSWEVDVDESDTDPGCYRILPYHEGTPVADAVGVPDNNYVYIDATDPTKVYIEDFVAYSGFPYTYWFSQKVPENMWDVEYYGTLEDNVIYFPPSSFGYFETETAMFWDVNYEGEFKIALPGGEARPNWIDLGESVLTDGAIAPFIEMAGVSKEIPVIVQERDHRPGYYRLLGAFAPYGGTEEGLIIDATDPDFVVVPYQYTGIQHEVRGEIVVYSHCENFISPAKYPTYADYAEAYPEFVATFKDGVITIPADGWVLHFPDYNPLSYWTNDEFASTTTVRIPLKQPESKVETTVSQKQSAPIYYDMHGRRVQAPEKAGVYVVVKDGEAKKIIVK